jgi:hemerythrin-like domain-containing protein
MSDVFNVLSQDHAEVKRMLAELHARPAATTGGTAEQLEGRKKLADQLIAAELSHEAAEERFFWPAVRRLGPAAIGLAEEAIRQEQEARQSLAALGRLDVAAAAFEPLLTEVINSGHEHIAFEEEQVWPLLRQAISAEEALELGSKIRKARETGPTRPQPPIPATPEVLKAGSAAAALDKLRDAATAWGES